MLHPALPQRHPRTLLLLAILVGLLAFPGTSDAQSKDFTVGAFLSFGGATDADPDSGLDDSGFQLLFAYQRDIDNRFNLRIGQMSLDNDDGGSLFDADLDYLTLSGEYQFSGGHYESGLFLGLGLYSIDGSTFVDDEESLGLNLGVSGDFRLTDRFSLLAEFSLHYADLDFARFFLLANVGVGFHF